MYGSSVGGVGMMDVFALQDQFRMSDKGDKEEEKCLLKGFL